MRSRRPTVPGQPGPHPGFTLAKTRRRDRLATDWGWFITQGSRQLAHFRDLDSIEHWLLHPDSRQKAG